MPWAVPTIAAATMFRWIYNADYGALNGLLYQLGLIDKYIPWLADPVSAMNMVIIADVWKSTPFVVLIVLAAMAGIPGELSEASRIDGASRWQSFWRVTLPLLKGAVLVVLVVRTVEAFRVFDIIHVLTGASGQRLRSYQVRAYQETFRLFSPGRRRRHQLHHLDVRAGRCPRVPTAAVDAPRGVALMGPSRLERVLALLVTVLLLLIIFLPIAWMVISSVSPREELLATPPHWIPQRLDLSNYQDILVPGEQASDVALTFRTALVNSIQVASLVTIIGLLLAIPAAYALSRIPMPGGRVTMTAILATRMLPAIATVIPLYLMAATLGLMDTKAVLVILYLSFVLPFNVWILTGFFSTIPREIEEAARIDGAGRLRVLRSVILPLSRPGIAATAIYSFLLAWDEFFFPLIFTSTREAKMVPVAISEFTGRHAVDFGAMATGGVLAAIPVVIVALVFDRLIVSGLTAGAVKE